MREIKIFRGVFEKIERMCKIKGIKCHFRSVDLDEKVT